MRRLSWIVLCVLCTGCVAALPIKPGADTVNTKLPNAPEAAPAPHVTLHIFSGRSDPTWDLDAMQAAELIALLNVLEPGEARPEPNRLGYRGFLVEGLEGDGTTLAAYSGIARRSPSAVEALADPDRTIERWLLASGEDTLGPELTGEVRQMLEAEAGAIAPLPQDAEFAITLVADGVTPAEVLAMADLGAIPLETKPLLAGVDFASYDAETHAFTLTTEAEARLLVIDLPVSGRAFVVTVGDERIYTGAFWTPLSSLSYDGVVIMLVGGFGPIGEDGVYRIELGYPGPGFYTGPDPRSDPRIIDAVR